MQRNIKTSSNYVCLQLKSYLHFQLHMSELLVLSYFTFV